MSDPARRKQKQKLKRLQKKQKERRQNSVGMTAKILAAAEKQTPVECFINANWRDAGIANLFVSRFVPSAGGYAMAAFMVDLWCLGLDDVFGAVRPTPELFRENVEIARESFPMMPIALPEARSLIASAVRFSRDNGFNLPKGAQRWIAVLGELGDIDAADISHFGRDGKLVYRGGFMKLRTRLMTQSIEDFVKRENVIIEASESDFQSDDYFDDDDEFDFRSEAMAIADNMQNIRDRALEGIRRWCLGNGETPEPRLEAAWDFMMRETVGEEKGNRDPVLIQELQDELMARFAVESGCDAEGCRAAVEQIARFGAKFTRYEDMIEAIGFDPAAEE